MYSVSHLLHTTKLLCQPWDFLNNQITFEKLLIGKLWIYFTPLLIEKKLQIHRRESVLSK